MRALNCHVERVFNPDRKDHHWGKTKTQEGRMNCIGRLAIFAVLLIVALLIIWQVFGAPWGERVNQLLTASKYSGVGHFGARVCWLTASFKHVCAPMTLDPSSLVTLL